MATWSYDKKHNTGQLVVDGGLTIACVSEVRDDLLRGFKEAASLSLDLTGVREFDVAGLQLLCSAHRHAVKDGKSLRLTVADNRLREFACAVGFDRGTHCPAGCENTCFFAGMA